MHARRQKNRRLRGEIDKLAKSPTLAVRHFVMQTWGSSYKWNEVAVLSGRNNGCARNDTQESAAETRNMKDSNMCREAILLWTPTLNPWHNPIDSTAWGEIATRPEQRARTCGVSVCSTNVRPGDDDAFQERCERKDSPRTHRCEKKGKTITISCNIARHLASQSTAPWRSASTPALLRLSLLGLKPVKAIRSSSSTIKDTIKERESNSCLQLTAEPRTPQQRSHPLRPTSSGRPDRTPSFPPARAVTKTTHPTSLD